MNNKIHIGIEILLGTLAILLILFVAQTGKANAVDLTPTLADLQAENLELKADNDRLKEDNIRLVNTYANEVVDLRTGYSTPFKNWVTNAEEVEIEMNGEIYKLIIKE